ncbi:hypothetical protein B0H19DRAFT_1253314 [Mycena capillaripes]|nr:hypothetical protein B0H19DRAFT_1253314 [Mycena capillaripes]
MSDSKTIQFRVPNNGDFRLKQESPATGTLGAAPEEDVMRLVLCATETLAEATLVDAVLKSLNRGAHPVSWRFWTKPLPRMKFRHTRVTETPVGAVLRLAPFTTKTLASATLADGALRLRLVPPAMEILAAAILVDVVMPSESKPPATATLTPAAIAPRLILLISSVYSFT